VAPFRAPTVREGSPKPTKPRGQSTGSGRWRVLRVAIFGGTFDPIHCAHLTIAREAVRAFSLSRVLFIPAAHPPHKSGAESAAYEDRYRMVELACQGEPLFEPSRLEAGTRKNYSIHTIERVKAALGPGDELFFLIGADAFAEVHSWFRWRDVVRETAFIVVSRPGHSYTLPPGARVERLETLALPVSSSEIRSRLEAGEACPELPPAVTDYILKRGLYRKSGEPSVA
jgi:nicotinate-nucleotide adenylyltransferase